MGDPVTAPDVRTAAQAEAKRIRFRLKGRDYQANRHYKLGFADGAVWGAALVTPTREQIAEAIAWSADPEYGIVDDVDLGAADAVLALITRGTKEELND